MILPRPVITKQALRAADALAGGRWGRLLAVARAAERRHVSVERPEAVQRLDRYLSVARLVHETIWELHNRLLAADRYDEHAQESLKEAARIVTLELPAALREATHLRQRWSEQEPLDPAGAHQSALALGAELHRVDGEVRSLRVRQQEIARELRALLGK
jgi:hypothetical protein